MLGSASVFVQLARGPFGWLASVLVTVPATEPKGYPLTTKDVAARYALGEQAVRILVRRRQLRAIKFLGKLRFCERDLRDFEKRSGTTPPLA